MCLLRLKTPAALFALLLVTLQPLTLRAEGGGTPVECSVSSSEQVLADADAAEKAPPPCAQLLLEDDYTSVGSRWRIGFGAGYGERSNPLIQSDDIPIYGILQLSWFGEHFFFDNGDVGWFMADGAHWSANLIAGVGGERSFFSFLNDSPVGFPPLGTELGGPGMSTGPDGTVAADPPPPEAPDRDYVIDGGVELLYEWGGSELQMQLLTDISDKHNGQELWLSWGLPQKWGSLSVYPSLGVTWMSADAADYYFGVRASEAQPGLPAYDVGNALNYFARLSLSYRLGEHWQLVSVLQYEQLADDIADSPSVAEDHVTTSFIGLYYEF